MALGMELEGKIAYAWSAEVRNPFAGTCLQVHKHIGEEVTTGEILAVYELDPAERSDIKKTLDQGELHSKQAELQLTEARIREVQKRVEGFSEAVRDGVESQARRDKEADFLALLGKQRDSLHAETQDISRRLREDRELISMKIGAPLPSSGDVPREAFLRSPADGVLAEQKIAPKLELAKNRLCFQVARKQYYASAR